jgi:hypothetical protein
MMARFWARFDAWLIDMGFIAAPVEPTPTFPITVNGEIHCDDGTPDGVWLHGADVEIWEQCTQNQAVLKPSRIRINGIEVLMADEPYVIHPVGKSHAAKVTVTMFIRTLSIHGVQPEQATDATA